MLSGNNTVARRTETIDPPMVANTEGHVADLTDPTVAITGLPDTDLYRIAVNTPGAVPVAVGTGLGTVLMGHEVRPGTNDLWLLNTEALNADPARQSEPEVRGDFVRNRITRVDLAAPGTPPQFIELDDADPGTAGVQFGSGFGKPYDLAFSSSGYGFVISTLNDKVRMLDGNGVELTEWDLTEGCIPRGVELLEPANTLTVLCWGTNVVEGFDVSGFLASPGTISGAPPSVMSLSIGYDPTPEARKRGREIFYDGDNSLHANASCESCHVEGDTDGLVWNLSEVEKDDKGPLVTQSLKGIEPTLPYHWRGERSFADFNPAFDGLLGGTELTSAELADFQAYIFSLQNPANPFQDSRRVVTSDATVTRFLDGSNPGNLTPNAVDGQEDYLLGTHNGGVSCESCHQLPLGTANDFFIDITRDRSQRATFTVAAFNGLWRKHSQTVPTVTWADGSTNLFSGIGAGFSHAGGAHDLHDFMTVFPSPSHQDQDRMDIAMFVHQVDSGLAPAAHQARYLDVPANPTGYEPLEWTVWAIEEAKRGNVDLVFIGTKPNGLRKGRWYYDRDLDQVWPESLIFPAPMSINDFFVPVLLRWEDMIVIAVPVGMGRRFGVDADNDLLLNKDEGVFQLSMWNADHDGDGLTDGTEIYGGSDPKNASSNNATLPAPAIVSVREMYTTTHVSKILVRTDQLTDVDVVCSTPGEPDAIVASPTLARRHTLFLRDLLPGVDVSERTYTCTITVENEVGGVATTTETISTKPFVRPGNFRPGGFQGGHPDIAVTDDLTVSLVSSGAGLAEVSFEAYLEERRNGNPFEDHRVVVRVLRNGVRVPDGEVEVWNGSAWVFPPMTMDLEFPNDQMVYAYEGEGPFVESDNSDATGAAVGQFRVSSVASGDVISVTLETAYKVIPDGIGGWEQTSSTRYHFPESEEDGRASNGVVVP